MKFTTRLMAAAIAAAGLSVAHAQQAPIKVRQDKV